MKISLFKTLALAILFSISSCNTINVSKENMDEKATSKEQVTSHYAPNTFKVVKIEYGKDGYMASLENGSSRKYIMLVSIVNLKDDYVSLKVGDKIQVEGQYEDETPVRIIPKKIIIIE
ncbi:MAG: hypothetical protein ACEPOV_04195 [Hyphomicrobiales bacterium]